MSRRGLNVLPVSNKCFQAGEAAVSEMGTYANDNESAVISADELV